MVRILASINTESVKTFVHKWGLLCGGILALVAIGICVAVLLLMKKKGQAKSEGEAASSEICKSMDNGFFRIDIGNCQGVGERDEQQDAFGFSPNGKWKDKGFLAVLCDGMGGLDSGAVISNKLVADVIKEFPYSFDELKEGWIIDSLSAEIYSQYYGRGGTTLIITFLKDDKLWFASVGDSDLLLYRDGRIYAMNQRQEYGNHLLMKVVDDALSLDQVIGNSDAPALTEFMGAQHVEPDYSLRPWQVKEGDVYLLCSDGVSDTLTFEEIRDAMSHDASECAELLEKGIIEKNKRFQDNYTAIVFSIKRVEVSK